MALLFGFVLLSVVLGNKCGSFNCNRTEHCCNWRYTNAACLSRSANCPHRILCNQIRGCESGANCCNPGHSNSYCSRKACKQETVPCGQEDCNGGEKCCNNGTVSAQCVLKAESCPRAIKCSSNTDCGTNAFCCNPGCYGSQCVYNVTGVVPCPYLPLSNCPLQCGNTVCGANQFCCAKGYVNQHCVGNNVFCSVPINCTNTTRGLGSCGAGIQRIGLRCCNPGCYDSYCSPAVFVCPRKGDPQNCPVPCGNITCPFSYTCCNPECANRMCSKSHICPDDCVLG